MHLLSRAEIVRDLRLEHHATRAQLVEVLAAVYLFRGVAVAIPAAIAVRLLHLPDRVDATLFGLVLICIVSTGVVNVVAGWVGATQALLRRGGDLVFATDLTVLVALSCALPKRGTRFRNP